uniref:Phosphopantothenate---cysteine ligase n=1 Tax=Angomonas deanei TaxID=59799 RepID=T1YT09_9TRYP|nr:phosphopantothenate---cysteine ligase [Angomonas deanei]
MDSTVETLFNENLSPEEKHSLDEKIQALAAELVKGFSGAEPPRGVAFITSGGTAVPLEVNAVRYITNFSSGGRGAFLVESFVERGWACISLRSKDAVVPFRRVFNHLETEELFSATVEGKEVSGAARQELAHMSSLYEKSKRLVTTVLFDNVVEYLYLLRGVSQLLCDPARAFNRSPLIFFAAAAVSDYYIPREKMSREKISGGDGLTIHLENVPKVLGVLQDDWLHRSVDLPPAFTVTFKLETNEETMHQKAQKNLNSYRCGAVVANMLQTYKEKVWVYLLTDVGKEPFLLTKGEHTIEFAMCDLFISLVCK